MALVTERATQAERAEAWDRLMVSTKSDSQAILDAYTWLARMVDAREAAERKGK